MVFFIKMKLDAHDTKLLAELDSNARQTYLQLGRKLRLSKDAVKYRMERLEKTGVIDGYYTEINTKQLGYTAYRFYLKLQNLDKQKKQHVIDWFVKRRETFFIAEVIGPWDLSVLVWAEDHESLEALWNEFKKNYCHHLQRYLLSIFTRLHIFPRKYLGSKPHAVYVQDEQKAELDNIDKKILGLLSAHARLGFVDIANQIKTSAKVIAYRVRGLEKQGVILKYRAKINYSLLGKEYFKVDMNLNDTSKMNSFHQFAYLHPNIIYINQTLGATDFEFDVETESFEKLTEIIAQFQENFPGTVRDYFYFQILKVHKVNYFPEQ